MKRLITAILLASMVGVVHADEPDFYVNALGYKILSTEELTCEVAHGNYGGEVYVPSEVIYGNKTYKVIGIGAEAFRGSQITALSMANTIQYIRKYACAICLNLRKVTVASSVMDIEDAAFASDNKLETFILEDGDETLVCVPTDYYFYPFPKGYLKTLYVGRNFTKDLFGGNACMNLTDLTIGDQVTNFELTSFPSLRRLTVGRGLATLPYMETGDYLTKVTVTSETPISCGGFNNRTYVHATLFVPQGSKEVYSQTTPWSNFYTIEEFDPTSVSQIEKENNTTIQYYLLDGCCVEEPQKGINIMKRSNGTTTKVLIK